MKSVETKLHKENIPLYVNDMPYVKEYADGTVDYCLGSDYESAGKVIRALIEIKKDRNKDNGKIDKKEKRDVLPD